MKGRLLALGLVAAAGAVLWRPRLTLALATESEEQRIGKAVQAALEKHGPDVNRCFEKALADTIAVSGKVDLAVDVGDEGRVTRAVPLEHTATSPVLLACLASSAAGWTMPGVAAGATVILPLAFESQAAQFSIKTADAPERIPGAPKHRAKGAPERRLRAPAFTVKVLVDEKTMRAQKASLSLLTIASAHRIAMHKHPGSEVLYVKRGRARVLGPRGVSPEILPEGSAIFIPGGMPHAIENMVRTATVELLQVFAPPGPERVYRDPKDEKGRAQFDVIRDEAGARVPPGARFAVESFEDATVYHQAGDKVRVHLFFDPSISDSRDASLSVLEIDKGAVLPEQTNEQSAEILYVLSGGGEMRIGSEAIPFAADQAICIPENQPYAARFTGPDKTIMLRVYAPAGPEQKMKVAGPVRARAPKSDNKKR